MNWILNNVSAAREWLACRAVSFRPAFPHTALRGFVSRRLTAHGFQAGSLGSTYPVTNLLNPNYTFFQSNGSAAFLIQTIGVTPAPMIFGVNVLGTTREVGRFSVNGNFILGTSADTTSAKLQVSAATNPIQLVGLSATTADTNVLSVDASGVVHQTTTSNLHPNGQVVLSAGTKSITVNGVLSTSKGFPGLAAASGFTNTIEYLVSCSTNTVLIKALNSSGGTNVSDFSTVNYFVII